MNDKRPAVYLQRVYPEIIRPKLRDLRSQLDANAHPVMVVFLDAYLKRMGTFYRGGRKGAESSLVSELKELEPLLFTGREISAPSAHRGPLGAILEDAGYSYPEIYDTFEAARKAKRGREREVDLSIEALEMQLAGKSYAEIANHQLGQLSNNLSKDRLAIERQRRKDLIRQRVKTIEPIYEKYRK